MAGARRRVAVTGLGALTPLGSGLTASWLGILESKCGVVSVKDEIHQMTGLRYDGLPSLVAAVIPSTVGLKDWAFDARSYLETWVALLWYIQDFDLICQYWDTRKRRAWRRLYSMPLQPRKMRSKMPDGNQRTLTANGRYVL